MGHGRSRHGTLRADVRDGRDASRRAVGAGMIGQLGLRMATMAWSLSASGDSCGFFVVFPGRTAVRDEASFGTTI